MDTSPTILRTGTIVEQKWMSDREKDKIHTQPAIQILIDKVADMESMPHSASVNHKILLLKSGTGSGKSTNVGPHLFMHKARSIAVTQPRILNAVEIPQDITKYRKEFDIGRNMGYQTSALKKLKTQRRGIMFMTIGILKQQFILEGAAWVARSYDIIIIDEVHEKNLDTDMIMKHLKQMYADSTISKYPVTILMSATFDESIFMDYFNVPRENYLIIEGYSYPIQEIWPEYDIEDYIKHATELVRQIHTTQLDSLKKQQRDIIIFVKSAAEINQLIASIMKLNNDADMIRAAGAIYAMALSREIFLEGGQRFNNVMSDIADVKVVEKVKISKPTRRVIIATNVAETGVTINSLLCVIDTGYFLNVWEDPAHNSQVIASTPVTKFMAMQRRGRVGRKAPGIWYPLYTKDTFHLMYSDQPSKLVTSDISLCLLNVIILDTGAILEVDYATKEYKVAVEKSWTPADIDLVAMPCADTLNMALEKLVYLGFIDHNFRPTALGIQANRIGRGQAETLRMLLAGYSHGACILDLITISAFLDVGWINVVNVSRSKFTPISPIAGDPKLVSRMMWACDFIEYLWIWYAFTEQVVRSKTLSALEDWCSAVGIDMAAMFNISLRRDELITQLMTLNMNPFYNGLGMRNYNLYKLMKNVEIGMGEIIKIKKCLIDGFRLNICKWDPIAERYVNVHKRVPLRLEDYSHISQPIISKLSDEKTGKAQYIIAGRTLLRQKFGSDLYEFVCGSPVSVIDGFVDLDVNWISSQ